MKRPTPLTDEAWESLLIAKTFALVERQLADGTASSTTILHFLKAGSTRARLEIKRLEHDISLVAAKTDQIRSMASQEELMANAMKAMKEYTGDAPEDYDADDY